MTRRIHTKYPQIEIGKNTHVQTKIELRAKTTNHRSAAKSTKNTSATIWPKCQMRRSQKQHTARQIQQKNPKCVKNTTVHLYQNNIKIRPKCQKYNNNMHQTSVPTCTNMYKIRHQCLKNIHTIQQHNRQKTPRKMYTGCGIKYMLYPISPFLD